VSENLEGHQGAPLVEGILEGEEGQVMHPDWLKRLLEREVVVGVEKMQVQMMTHWHLE
jgi:hypothetical protein